MPCLLIITNSSKPTKSQYESSEAIRIGSFSAPCVLAALECGFDVVHGVNRKYASNLQCDYPIRLYDQYSYRNPFHLVDNLKGIINAVKTIKKYQVDVIHCNTPVGGLIGRVSGRLTGVKKVIYTAHGFHFYHGSPFFNRTVLKWAEYYLARWTDAIITINKEDYGAAEQFHLRNHGNVYQIHGVGINLNEFQRNNDVRTFMRNKLKINESTFVLISAGDLNKNKNYELALKAFAEAKINDSCYLICGTGKEETKLKEISRSLGIDNRVLFLGYRNDVSSLMQAADAYLITSKREGLPRAMMEAMAIGLPCIASRIRGCTDLIENGVGGFLCDLDKPYEFARAIKRIAESNEFQTECSLRNLEFIKGFSTVVVENEIKKIYQIEVSEYLSQTNDV